jgi:hypothetical protein
LGMSLAVMPSELAAALAERNYTLTLQRLVVYSVRGYMSERRKPAELSEINERVNAWIHKLKREGQWPREWQIPHKRTVDRRVNEVASWNALENFVLQDGKPPLMTKVPGFYFMNPKLFEDVRGMVEASP